MKLGSYYHRRLESIHRFLVPAGQRVLELGCGCGDLLHSLAPSRGVGVDFSPEMVAWGKQRHPDLEFILGDVHDAPLDGEFDVIILSDLATELWNIQHVLERVTAICKPETRVIINTYSRAWELPLAMANRLNLARPSIALNWLAPGDVKNLLYLAGLEPVHHWEEILWPVSTPLLDSLFNKYLVKLWPFRTGALTNFFVCRKQPDGAGEKREPVVSVVVPARNEAGNIAEIFQRTPSMGAGTELIFVEGHSNDDTYEVIERAIAAHPHRKCKLLRQTGKGKGDAVRLGFSNASGDILMILDADLTVAPEDLPRFYAAIESGKGEFINGVRLLYPMEAEAMRFLNLLGNKFFSVAFSWLLGQSIKDTLCGTKVLRRGHYERIAANRSYFGDFDPFGDFDLIFGAARLNMKIVDLPVRYRKRMYGETNIHRWSHGFLLLKMAMFALRRIKFV